MKTAFATSSVNGATIKPGMSVLARPLIMQLTGKDHGSEKAMEGGLVEMEGNVGR